MKSRIPGGLVLAVWKRIGFQALAGWSIDKDMWNPRKWEYHHRLLELITIGCTQSVGSVTLLEIFWSSNAPSSYLSLGIRGTATGREPQIAEANGPFFIVTWHWATHRPENTIKMKVHLVIDSASFGACYPMGRVTSEGAAGLDRRGSTAR